MKLFVGFDMQNSNIKIMNAERPTDEAVIEHLHFNSLIFSDEFFEEAKELLHGYFEKNPSLQNLHAFVVLPNQAVGFETFNLPNMPRSKMLQALDVEMDNLYEGKHKNNKINKFFLRKTKQFSTYGAVYFNKGLVAKIYDLLTEVKVFPKMTTYSGNALMNCAYQYSSKLRGKSFVFADMHADYTEIAVSSKGETLGVAVIPHGASLIKTDKVELEYMQTDHEVGEIAVINAKESAKSKALTQTEEEADEDLSVIPENATISDYAVDSAEQAKEYSGTGETADESAEQSNSASEQTSGTAEQTSGAETSSKTAAQGAANSASVSESAEPEQTAAQDGSAVADDSTAADEASEEDFYESEEEERKRLEELEKKKAKKVKVYRKMPKRYPKFMMRELPTTEQEFQYENFRIIMKWILAYARQAQLSEYTVSPEFIVINMPEELYPLLDIANKEQEEEGTLQFRPFSLADKFVPTIKGNLNLYGCLFASHYNKNHNF